MFNILKINRIMPFCNLFMERPSYFVFLIIIVHLWCDLSFRNIQPGSLAIQVNNYGDKLELIFRGFQFKVAFHQVLSLSKGSHCCPVNDDSMLTVAGIKLLQSRLVWLWWLCNSEINWRTDGIETICGHCDWLVCNNIGSCTRFTV